MTEAAPLTIGQQIRYVGEPWRRHGRGVAPGTTGLVVADHHDGTWMVAWTATDGTIVNLPIAADDGTWEPAEATADG